MEMWWNDLHIKRAGVVSQANASAAAACYGRVPHDGAVDGSISASVILAAFSLKSTNIDMEGLFCSLIWDKLPRIELIHSLAL